MIKKNKNLLFLFILLAILFGLSFVWSNLSFWMIVASSSDVPSKKYYFSIEKIYQIASEENICGSLLKKIESESLHGKNLAIHLIGITGCKSGTSHLIKKYAEYQNDDNHLSLTSFIVDSLGNVGDTSQVLLLEKLLSNYEQLDVSVTKYALVRALFLATGKRYKYIDSSNNEKQIFLTEELAQARRVVENSMSHQRSFEDMIILDKLYRPSSWSN